MTRRARTVLAGLGAVVLLALLVPSLRHLPPVGGRSHPMRDRVVAAALAHQTANAVAAVNFDQRGFDTLGEETILLVSVTGAAALLRPRSDQRLRPAPAGRVFPPVNLLAYLLLPVTLVIGADLVLHGVDTPGGGFQGGVALATGLHLLYVGGTLRALDRLRPLVLFEVLDALGNAAYATTGIAAAVTGATFLANVAPWGGFGSVISGGTVFLLNLATGVEVTAGIAVLLTAFLRQTLQVERVPDAGSSPPAGRSAA